MSSNRDLQRGPDGCPELRTGVAPSKVDPVEFELSFDDLAEEKRGTRRMGEPAMRISYIKELTTAQKNNNCVITHLYSEKCNPGGEDSFRAPHFDGVGRAKGFGSGAQKTFALAIRIFERGQSGTLGDSPIGHTEVCP